MDAPVGDAPVGDGTLGRGRLVGTGDWRAYVEEAGDGPPIVLVASMLIRARTYRPLVGRLARDFRVLVVELPGCGRATKLRRPWHFMQYADALAALVPAMGLERAAVLGHSNSGAVALLAAAHHPERVWHLILADAVGADPAHSLARVAAARAIDAFFELAFSMHAVWDVASNAIGHTRTFARQIRLSACTDVTADAAHVTAPTLLAWGRLDLTMPPRCAERLRRHLADARLYVSPTGSHDWLITHAEEFAAVVRQFMHDAAPGAVATSSSASASPPSPTPAPSPAAPAGGADAATRS